MNDAMYFKHALRRIVAVGFSPCGGTEERLRRLAERLGELLGLPIEYRWYTLPEQRVTMPIFERDCLVVWASPVYAGRLPNKLTDYVAANLRGKGCPFVGLVTYGNRSEGEALSELVGIARRGGCRPVAAAAVAVEHVFSSRVGTGRPSKRDEEWMDEFVLQVAARINCSDAAVLPPFGNEEPTAFYQPLRDDGEPARFLKAMPEVEEVRCMGCGRCAMVCPMGSVAMKDGLPHFEGKCIKCQACVRCCGNKALQISHPDFVAHVRMLEQHYGEPAANRFYLA